MHVFRFVSNFFGHIDFFLNELFFWNARFWSLTSVGADYCSFDCPSCGYRTAADRPSSNTGFALCATTSVLPDDDTATDAFWPNWGLTAIFGDPFTFYFIGLICILTNFVNYDDLMLLDTDFFFYGLGAICLVFSSIGIVYKVFLDVNARWSLMLEILEQVNIDIPTIHYETDCTLWQGRSRFVC